jgi:hypothetical protein
MSRLCLAIVVTLAVLTSAQAQHAPASPYAGWKHRAVKALSDQQIADLRTGRGMGLALPADPTDTQVRSMSSSWVTSSG